MLFFQRQRLVDLASVHRIPAMWNAREFVEIGGLIMYGASIDDLSRRASVYVDRIIRGSKPSRSAGAEKSWRRLLRGRRQGAVTPRPAPPALPPLAGLFIVCSDGAG